MKTSNNELKKTNVIVGTIVNLRKSARCSYTLLDEVLMVCLVDSKVTEPLA